MNDTPHHTVSRDDSAARYVITVDDGVAGFAAFQESATHIAFTHTEIDEAHQGQGLASLLAAAALADAVALDKIIIPLCPYIARYLERHQIQGARIEWPTRAPRK